MSGSLFLSVPKETLTDTGNKELGGVWFFHHDHAMRDNGVRANIPFRVYQCSLNAPLS